MASSSALALLIFALAFLHCSLATSRRSQLRQALFSSYEYDRLVVSDEQVTVKFGLVLTDIRYAAKNKVVEKY